MFFHLFLDLVCDNDGIDALDGQASYSFGHCDGTLSAILFRNKGHAHFFPYRVIIHPNKCNRRLVPPAAASTAMNPPWTRWPWWSFSSCSWFVATVDNRSASVERWWLCFTVGETWT